MTTKNARAKPYLTIRYRRAGRVYAATYRDDEAVTLPDDGRGSAAPKGGGGRMMYREGGGRYRQPQSGVGGVGGARRRASRYKEKARAGGDEKGVGG